jgi:hypothetical protein
MWTHLHSIISFHVKEIANKSLRNYSDQKCFILPRSSKNTHTFIILSITALLMQINYDEFDTWSAKTIIF